jgi:hypothetical protein
MDLIGEICDPPSQQTVLPVTLRVSGYDEDDKPMCVFHSEICSDSYFVIFSARNGHHLPAVRQISRHASQSPLHDQTCQVPVFDFHLGGMFIMHHMMRRKGSNVTPNWRGMVRART